MATIKLENIKITIKELSVGPKILRLTQVKSPPREVIFENLNLEIKDGETLVILGPTGCGKTTLLRVIAGLIIPKEGKVYFDNLDYTKFPPQKRNIGMVFQSYALYPHYTSKGNLSFKFWLRKTPQPVIDEKINETVKLLGIDFKNILNKMPKNLSMGEKQKVALGRCIIGNPKVLLFDEPLSNLDAKERSLTRVNLKKLLSKFKITTVYVTHDQSEAFILADRIAVMNETGGIEQVGTFEQIYNHPYSIKVASFVGLPPMNILKPEEIDLFEIKKNFVGFHPEDVMIDEKIDEPVIKLKGIVHHIENLFYEKLIYVKIKNSTVICKTNKNLFYEKNHPIELFLPKSKLHFFN